MIQKDIFDECRAAGWDPLDRNSLAEEIAHLHDELSEAFRALRKYHDCGIYYDEDGKPQGVPIEFADVLIGLFYNAQREGFDMWEALDIKRQWNLTRDYRAEDRQLHRPIDA